jgi:hypothetical protein
MLARRRAPPDALLTEAGRWILTPQIAENMAAGRRQKTQPRASSRIFLLSMISLLLPEFFAFAISFAQAFGLSLD